MECLLEFDEEKVKYVLEHEPVVDSLEKDITHYLMKLSSSNEMNPDLAFKQAGYLHACTDLERIGDHGQTLAKKGLFCEQVLGGEGSVKSIDINIRKVLQFRIERAIISATG